MAHNVRIQRDSCIEDILKRHSRWERADLIEAAVHCYYDAIVNLLEFKEDLPLFVLACDLFCRDHKAELPMDVGIALVEKHDKESIFMEACAEFLQDCERKRGRDE